MISTAIIRVLDELNKANARYMVVGGIAVVAHGHDRTTGDLDIWLSNDNENLKCLRKALIRADFDPEQVSLAIESYYERGKLTITIDERFPIELMPVYSSYIPFDEAYKKSKAAQVAGVEMRIVDLDTLLDMKIRAARPKDLSDVKALKEIHNLK